jgi:aminoglycoside phosphotransferase (APT) family kinase protein
MRIPTVPGDIDAAWLEGALALRHPGVTVDDVEIVDVREVTNTHVRVRACFGNPTPVPSDLFVKMPPLDPARRAAIARTDMGRREEQFYATLAPTLRLRVPACYAAYFEEDTGDFVLVLEDLVAAGCTISDGTVGVRPDAMATALEELAELHARFENADRRTREAGWVPRAVHGSNYGAQLLQVGLDHHRDRLSPDFCEIAQLYIDRGDDLQALWHSGPATVIHGDAHLGNLFDDHGRTGFLDWGIVNVSTPMRDVSYFITMAMNIQDRRAYERDLLRHYLNAAEAQGATPITFEDAWQSHRTQAAYTVVACCQVVTFPPDATERRRIFATAFLERAEAAIHDLDAHAAVKASI